jgi:hypothetical protein
VLSVSHAVIVSAIVSKISSEKEGSAMIISVTKNCKRKRKGKDKGKNYPRSPTERRMLIIEAVVREVLAPGSFGGG